MWTTLPVPNILFILSLFALCRTGLSETRQVRIPLQDGTISTAQIAQSLAKELHLPTPLTNQWFSPVDLALNLRGMDGWFAIRGLNAALGDGFSLRVDDNALVVRCDTDRLPASWKEACGALEAFTAVAAPDAVARQNLHYGMRIPAQLNLRQPLVIVIHGMEGMDFTCQDLVDLLNQNGQQTAVFGYPGERPLDDSARALQVALSRLHSQYPSLRLELVTESMGGLVARDCLEAPGYEGNVDRLIMIAPPNHGSNWASLSILLKIGVNASRWWNNADWSPAWLINEGIDEAAMDLTPGSEFLTKLNARPRNAVVRYTIIAGDRPLACRYEARALALTRDAIPRDGFGWDWLKRVDRHLQTHEDVLMHAEGESDGPVSLASARLAGVSDFVTIPADHQALYETTGGEMPAAWDATRDRLKN